MHNFLFAKIERGVKKLWIERRRLKNFKGKNIKDDLAASITSLQLAGAELKTAGNSERRTFQVFRLPTVSIFSSLSAMLFEVTI